MADPHQVTGQVDTHGLRGLSDDIVILDSGQIENGINEEMLRQSLVDGGIDSTSITYTVSAEESESLGTGLRSASMVRSSIPSGAESLGEIIDIDKHGHSEIHQITAGSENVLVTNSQSVFTADTIMGINNGEISNNTTTTVQGLGVGEAGKGISVFASVSNDNCVSKSHQNDSGTESHSCDLTNNGTMQGDSSARSNGTHQLVHLTERKAESDSLTHDTCELKFHTIPQSPALQVSAPRGISMTPEVLQSVIQQVKAQQLNQHSTQHPQSSQDLSENEIGPQNNSVSFTLVSPSQQSTAAAPLGSSQNPIRIIQQGNRYTPMQQLTPEQLQQIMQVVQQQHANKAQDNGGTVIFNPHTNTKIMYRVIYPSELHKSQASGQATYQVIRPVTLSQEQQTTTPHQKRPYRKRKDATALSAPVVVNGDEERERGSGDTPELSKEEKEERKKHRPRTRSGRVSKPPKHMVQDYKHIHVLDWDEDYDDSDGGYSDLKQSDEESKARQNDQEEQDMISPDLFQALGAGKPKNFKCHTCEKSYIGQAGLERHYRLTPEHRRADDDNLESQVQNGLLVDGESSKDASITQDGNSSRNSDPGPDVGKFNGLDNFSEDSNTQDSIKSAGTSSPVVRRGRGRGGYRGRWAHLKHNAHTRRKNKLREFTKLCSDEDLMEVLFPRLVGSISTWEFLMMKAEKGGSRPKVDVIYKEFEDLLRPLKQVCADYMKPISKGDIPNLDSNDKVIKVSDQNLASCLGLSLGIYKVEEMLPDDSNSFSSLHNKLSAASISLSSNTTSHNINTALERDETFDSERSVWHRKRKFVATSPSKAESIPLKKPCLMNSVSAVASSGQTLVSLDNSEHFKSEPLLLQSTSNILSSSPSTHSLKSIVNPSSNVIKVECSSSPPTSHQSVSYLITAQNNKGNTATTQALKSQLVPVVLNTSSGTSAVSSSQMLPVVLNPKTSRGMTQQTIMVTSSALADTNNKTAETNNVPLVLTAQGGQFQGNTIFLASGNQSVGQSVLLKQPSKQTVQEQKQKFISTQQHISPFSKSQISLLGSLHTSNTNGTAKVSSVSSSTAQRYNSNTKPAEVRVSRKLFHEATASSSVSSIIPSSLSSSSSLYANSNHMNNAVLVTSPHNVKVEYATSSSISSLLPSSSLSLNSAFMDHSHLQIVSGSSLGNTKTELANQEPTLNALESSRATGVPVITSVSSLATSSSDLSRVVTSGNDEDLDTSFDISAGVLSSMGFSGDELSSLNTSSDNPPSIPISLPNLGVNQVSSVMNEIITSSNGVPLIPSKTAGNCNSLTSINHVSNTDLTFINGSNSEFPTISPPSLKLKDNVILQPSSQSSSSFMSSTSDLIHLLANKPSSPLMSSPCKDSALNTVTSVSFNLASMDSSLPSQILKSDGTSSAIMGDLGALAFQDQSVEQLNGVSSSLHSAGDVDSILQEQITQSDETVNTLLELPQQLVGDDMTMAAPPGEDDGQLLLTEGSNIYQTEDGTWFIQSADGITYQLQGAQGLPLETVQALLSGNLDLNGDAPGDEGVQTNVMH